eukprot:15367190-Ditylum_brightwellii.AAC.2
MQHICNLKQLFKELHPALAGTGIVGIGGVSLPEGIGNVVFQITDKDGKKHTIELENVLYIPDAPQNLISINQQPEEHHDNCGILSRGRYSVFLWGNGKAQDFFPHPVHCRIPIMQTNEGGTEKSDNFLQDHSTCLHDQVCMLANGTKAARPYWGLRRRGKQHRLSTADEEISSGEEKLQMAQPPTFDTSYPAGMTVKWQDKQKLQLATMVSSNEGETADDQEPQYQIRVLNTKKLITVPASSLSTCTTTDPADVPTSSKDIDPNAMETLITKEDLDKLWHKDQVALSKELRLSIYWHQRWQHPPHVSMIRLARRGGVPSALKYNKKTPPCAACLFAKAKRRA